MKHEIRDLACLVVVYQGLGRELADPGPVNKVMVLWRVGEGLPLALD